MATRRWSSKRMRIRSGLFCGSIYWVLLVSGRVSVPKPLSQIQRGTRRLLQGLSPRTSFGGFGLRGNLKPLLAPVPVRETHGVRRESPERAEPSLVGALGVPPQTPIRSASRQGSGRRPERGRASLCIIGSGQTITSSETKKTAPTRYGRRGQIALAAYITSSPAPSCPAAHRTWRRKRFASADSRGRTPHTSIAACRPSSFIDVSVTYQPAPVVYSAPKRSVNECAGGSAVGSIPIRKRFGP